MPSNDADLKINIKLHPSFWGSDLTYNTFVPISCDDIHDLNLINELYKKNGHPDTKAGTSVHPSAPFFFSNHPIVWVKVVGRVSKVSIDRRDVYRVAFSVSDGLGAKALQCTLFSSQIPDDLRLREGEMVVVFGKLEWFMGIQVRVNKLMLIEHSDPVRFYLFREECILTRRFVLENDAELFKSCVPRLKPLQIPTKSISELEIEQLSQLQHYLRKRRRQWVFKDNPLTYYQIWP